MTRPGTTTPRRSMRVLAIIAALLIVVPIIEIAVLIAVGQVIGIWPTLVLMLSTSALGAWLLRREGGRAWRVFQADVVAGRPPGPAATDGLLVLVGGIFMLIPGFASDVIGLVMILPPTRRIARVFVQNAFTRRISPAVATSLFGPRRVRATARPRPGQPPGEGGESAESPPGSTPPITGEIVEPDR